MTDKSTHPQNKCSAMENDTPWTIDSYPILREPCPIWGPDGDRVALVHGNVALDVTAEERAERIVEAVNNQQGPDDKLSKLQKKIGDVHLTLNAIEEEIDRRRNAIKEIDALSELDDVREKIRELHVYAECAITRAEHFERNAKLEEYREYWRGKRVARREILNKIKSLFDK